MCSQKIFNTLQICDEFKLDFYIFFKNYHEKLRYTPTFIYNIHPQTNLPIIISIYDEGWDEIDEVIFNNIADCIPIVNSNL
jgi:hypothetical protein